MTAAMEAETPGFAVKTPTAAVTQPSLYVRQTSGLVRTVGPRTALFANLVGMGIIVNFFWITEAAAFYPNANLITTVGIGVLINVGVGYVYWMLASAMPRSGGDYIFVGRIFHPSIGLGINLLFSVIFVTWAGLFAYFTAYYAIPTMLAGYSLAGGGAGALSMATTIFNSTTDIFVIGFVMLLIVILVSLLPTKWVFRVSILVFILSAAVFAIMIGILLATPQATFAADFNKNPVYGATYQGLVNAVPITTTGTFLGIVYTMLSFIGYANSSYYGGEIRGSPTRTQGLAIFGAPLIFAALIAGLYAASYYTFGRGFLIGISQSYFGTPGAVAWPGPLYLVAVIVHVPILAAFLSFGLILTFFGFSLIYFIIPTRNLFAWSFDRVFPAFLARVTRNGVPWVAVLVLAISSLLVLWLGTYTTFFDYATLGYSNFGFWFAVGIVCLAGALFPFIRKQTFAQAPAIVRARIGRIPILTIVGIAAFAASWFVSYSASTTTYLGISAPSYSISDLLFLPIVLVIGIVIYWVSYAIQKGRGVPVDLISKELPPE